MNFLQGDNGNRRWWIIPVKGNGHVSEWLDTLQCAVPQLWAEAYAYYRQGMKLYLTTDMEFKANEIQVQHSSILVDPIMEDLEMFLEREVVCKLDHSYPTGLSKRGILRAKLNNDFTQHGLRPADYRGNA